MDDKEFDEDGDEGEPERPLIAPLLVLVPGAGVFLFVGWVFFKILA